MNQVQKLSGDTVELLYLFAEMYKPPTTEMWQELKSGYLLEKLKNVTDHLNISWPFVEVPQSYEELQTLYVETLSHQIETAAHPVESLYKQWTVDSSCALPFSKSKGYLLGDSALHILHILNEFEIEIPVEYASKPDHLAILLELLAYFTENSSEEFVQQFLQDHFDWLEEFEHKLIKATGEKNIFYHDITSLLMETLTVLENESKKNL